MKRWLTHGVRFFLVTTGVILLTSFTIDATDTLRGSQTALSIFSDALTRGECPSDMVRVDTGTEAFCIDKYEASPSEDCVFRTPRSGNDTAVNSADSNCYPSSVPDVVPWVYVAQPQALQLCAKVGKRLPTSKEWYRASLGTPDTASLCNISGTIQNTGKASGCTAGSGAFDMVGNVWEVVDGMVIDGVFDGVSLPEEGYVALVDEAGIPRETTAEPQLMYQNDYFWAEKTGQFVMLRGGFYGSQEDGGVYTTHAKTAPNFTSSATGFRCALSLPS